MATIDLGKIKIVWRGTYAGGTAYTVDDAVEHTDSGITSSFICTTASTGNAPSTGGSVHSSWAYLAKGSAAFATLTTQGDILYRGASADARLAKGTASQTLQMDGSAAFPTWTTVAAPAAEVVQIQYFQTNAWFEQTINGGWEALNDGSTDFVVSITPTSASNKILLHCSFGKLDGHNTGTNYGGALRWVKNVASAGYGVVTMVGNTGSNTLASTQGHVSVPTHHPTYVQPTNHTYLDTPATTSAIQASTGL